MGRATVILRGSGPPRLLNKTAVAPCDRGLSMGPHDERSDLPGLKLCQREIDRVFGDGYAAAHPDVVTAVVQSAASDWAASRIAIAIERVAEALLIERGGATHPAAARAVSPTPITRACTHKIAIGDSDLIKVRFAPLC